MALTPAYRAFLLEFFKEFGPVEFRRLFNFDGLFREDTIFGIVVEERVYLKCDENTRGKFAEEGSSAFRYRGRDGSEIVTSYYELPARLYDEPGEVAAWARAAFEAASRSSNTMRKAHRRIKGEMPRRSAQRRV